MAFFQEAKAFIEKLDPDARENMFVLSLENTAEQLKSWHWYFAEHRGFVPVALQSMLDRQTKHFTAPTEWPEWFDSTYRPPATLPAVIKQHSRLSHENYEELRQRFGPNWGLKWIEDRPARRSTYRPPTDDQLREIYADKAALKRAADAAGSPKPDEGSQAAE